MPTDSSFCLPVHIPVRASDAGLFISPGSGRHPTRTMDSFELIFVRSGCLRIRENDREFSIEKDETLLLWANREHGGLEDFPEDLSFVWIHFFVIPPEDKPQGVPAPTSERGPGGYLLNIPQHGRPWRTDHFRELTHRLLGEYGNRDHDTWLGRHALDADGPHFLVADLMLLRILAELCPATARTRNAAGEPAPVAKAIQYIDAHFHESITPASVGEALQYTSDYLGTLFHRFQGRTLTDFIQARRVAEARFLLRESGLSIKEIAGQCGFSDVGYFSRVFQKLQGATPSGYRRLHARTFVNARAGRPVKNNAT